MTEVKTGNGLEDFRPSTGKIGAHEYKQFHFQVDLVKELVLLLYLCFD